MLKQILDLTKSYIKTPTYWWSNVIWRYPKTISDLNVVFVIGAPRSGTTLLQKILSSHSMLFSIQDETGIFSYQNIFDKERKHFGLSDTEQEDLFNKSIDIINFFENGVKLLMSQNQEKIFIEKTPQHVLHIQFLMDHFPNAKFVHIVRDGRDAYCSAIRHPTMAQNKSIITYAKYWKKCVSIPKKFRNDSRLVTIKYEELADTPKVVLSSLMNFLDMSLEEEQLDPNVYGKDQRANLVQFKKLKSAISSSSVGRWENELTQEENEIFIDIARDELLFYGYNQLKVSE